MKQHAMLIDELFTCDDIFDTPKLNGLPYQIAYHTDRSIHQVFPIGEGVVTGIKRNNHPDDNPRQLIDGILNPVRL